MTDPTASITTDDELHDELLRRGGGQLAGPAETVRKFEHICRHLASTAQEMCMAYVETCRKHGGDPGETCLVLGGGRASGKPLKEDSDLDLFFYVENLKGRLGVAPLHRYPSDPLGALDEQVIARQEFLKLVGDMCKERDIPNEFHVLGLGDRMPERFNPENQIVIASHGHKNIAVVPISLVAGSLSSSDPASVMHLPVEISHLLDPVHGKITFSDETPTLPDDLDSVHMTVQGQKIAVDATSDEQSLRVTWQNDHVELILDAFGQTDVWPGHLADLLRTDHLERQKEDSLSALGRATEDVLLQSPVWHRDAETRGMSHGVLVVDSGHGCAVPFLLSAPDDWSQSATLMPIFEGGLNASTAMATFALVDMALQADRGGARFANALTSGLRGLSSMDVLPVVVRCAASDELPGFNGEKSDDGRRAARATYVARVGGLSAQALSEALLDAGLAELPFEVPLSEREVASQTEPGVGPSIEFGL